MRIIRKGIFLLLLAGILWLASYVCSSISTGANNLDLGRVFAKEIGIKGVRLHTQKHFAKAVEIINSHVLDGDLSRLITDIYPLDEIRHAFDEAGKGDGCFKILIQVSG